MRGYFSSVKAEEGEGVGSEGCKDYTGGNKFQTRRSRKEVDVVVEYAYDSQAAQNLEKKWALGGTRSSRTNAS